MHEDEEIRYIIEGGGYFDVRGEFVESVYLSSGQCSCTWLFTEAPTDDWVRLHVGSGDMLVLPAGIYHRFGLDMGMKSRTIRLFKVRRSAAKPPAWI